MNVRSSVRISELQSATAADLRFLRRTRKILIFCAALPLAGLAWLSIAQFNIAFTLLCGTLFVVSTAACFVMAKSIDRPLSEEELKDLRAFMETDMRHPGLAEFRDKLLQCEREQACILVSQRDVLYRAKAELSARTTST